MTGKNFAQGVAGGVLGASVLGLCEASFLMISQGASDLLAPFYAVVLYGMIGALFGVVAGIPLFVVGRVTPHGEGAPALAHSLGSTFSVVPMAGFILLYLGNKVVYAEQGVPVSGKLMILAALCVFAVLNIVLGSWVIRSAARAFMNPVTSLVLWLGMVAMTLALSFLAVGEDPRSSFAHNKPAPAGIAHNVLILTVDTLRADYLGAYGRGGDPTPTLDMLAADGVLFERASAHASWTRSSFASLFTSRIPSAHATDKKASRMSDDLVLVSEVLQQKGITTGNLANNINVTATFNFDQGYDTFIYEAPAYHFGATESVFSLTFYKVIHKLRERLGGAKEVTRFYQPAEVVLADAKRFIEANSESRWMLGVHLMEPHDPYFEHPYLADGGTEEYNGIGFARAEFEHPDPSKAEYLRKVYSDEIRHLDNKLAPFIRWLKQTDNYENTLIVLTADHGEEFHEHGGFWHGTTLYEEQIHVPLIMKLPGGELGSTRVPWQARLIDVAPTITASLGIPPSDTWAGRDLLATVRASNAQQKEDSEALEDAKTVISALAESLDAGTIGEEESEHLQRARTIRERLQREPDPCEPYSSPQDRVVIAEQDFEGNVLNAIILNKLKLIIANDANPRGLPDSEMFDLHNDPAEREALASSSKPLCGDGIDAKRAHLVDRLESEKSHARAGAVEATEVEVDAGETCRLCALGYLSGPQCDDC